MRISPEYLQHVVGGTCETGEMLLVPLYVVHVDSLGVFEGAHDLLDTGQRLRRSIFHGRPLGLWSGR